MPQTIKHATQATGTDAGDGEIGKAAWNADHTVTGTPDLPESVPAAPSSGLTMFARSIGGRVVPAVIDAGSRIMDLQGHLARRQVAWWHAQTFATAVSVFGGTGFSATGTATAANISMTSFYTYMRRVEYLVTTAATTAVASFRGGNFWARGDATKGGFLMSCVWGMATGATVATHRGFCGLRQSNAAPTDANPSTQINMIGMGWDSGDANISIMHNSGGATTKVDLGTNFPRPTTDRTNLYELVLYAPRGATGITWEVRNLLTGAVATGVASTAIPDATTTLMPLGYVSVGGTSSVIGLAFSSLYIENEY